MIEYSGYNVAGPTDPIPYVIASALGVPCTNCGDPNLLPDSATYVGAVLARLSGFATVSLQMRGTGCSGGAFDLFGYPSDYDAYDAIEIVAHQSWVANHRVGMVGISYSGLSQFPSAGTDPPALTAIAPLSPTDDLFSTGYPGGIYNNGFAASWVSARIDDAKPAATYSDGKVVQSSSTPIANVGQPWTYYEIDAELSAGNGKSTCLANQALHGQSEDLDGIVGPQLVAPGTGAGRDPSLFDRRSMVDWAQHVIVPVFLSGALEDEQTGPQWPPLIDAIPKTTPVFANMVNGGHIDSTDPQTISRWLEFLDIFVAGRVPTEPGGIDAIALDQFAGSASGVPSSEVAPLPPTRFTDAPNVTAARDDFASPDPARPGPLRQRGGRRRSGRHRVDVLSRLSEVATAGHRDEAALRAGRRDGLAEADRQGQRELHPRPDRPARHQPASGREPLGGPTRLGLDSRSRPQTGSPSRPRPSRRRRRSRVRPPSICG